MRFLLIIFIFFSCYSTLYANEIFNLLKIPNLEVLDLNSKNKIKYFNTKENFIIGATQNIVCDKVEKNNLNKKYKIVKKNLDIYSHEFLKKNNLRFVVLCKNLSISGIQTAGIPDKQKRTLILDINFDPKYFQRVIHHEVFHMIYDSNPVLFDEKIWRSFSIGNLVNLMMLDTRLYGREEQLNISSYLKGESLDKKGFKEDLAKPRDLLGNEQMNWISKTIDKKYKWSIFGQQLLIGPKYLPSIFGTKEMDNSRSYLRKQLAGQELPINTDQWDGYPKERDKFYNVIPESQSNIILAGDSHNSWFSNLYDKDEKFIGIEVGAPAISSPSFIDTFKDITKLVEDSFVAENRDLLWVNGKYKGYVSMNISEEFIDVSYKYVSTVKSREYKSLDPFTFRVEHNKPYSASNV